MPPAIIVVGYEGKMARALREACETEKLPFKIFSEKAPKDLRVEDFRNSRGVIDFSLPSETKQLIEMAIEAKVPLVCGTTGFETELKIQKFFEEASQSIPILWDSNFSLGVEWACRSAEVLGQMAKAPIEILDIHHIHKRDRPSGTALKIRDRILAARPNAEIRIRSERIGEVFGEHRISATFDDQSVEIVHRALSRRPFAYGALLAFEWLEEKQKGFYSVKDIIK